MTTTHRAGAHDAALSQTTDTAHPELPGKVAAAPAPAVPAGPKVGATSPAGAVSPTETLTDDRANPSAKPGELEKALAANKEGKAPTSQEMADEEARLAAMPKGLRLYLIMLGLLLGVFVVSLDQTIVAPAIPIISNHFNALADVGWYGSAYFATSTALQPLYGRLYRLNLKWPYVSCIVIFEIGSIICAVARDSKTFIVGRAIAGIGVAGGYIGVLTIISASVPLNKVPVWSGAVGAVYGIGAISGPLIGGVFTSEVTWRWCFWLSLPIGGVTLATVILFFSPPSRARHTEFSWLRTLWGLDLVGTSLALGAIICYLLALQDGGLTYSWSTSREIGLLVGFGVIIIAFVINEYFMGDDALMPLRILRTRTIAWSSIANFGIGASYFGVALFLPIYFQLRGSSSIRSGVQMLPLVCGVIFSVTVSGGAAPKVGYVQPFLYFGCVCGIVGAGLTQLFNTTTSQPFWVGTTFLFGIGIGAVFQMPFVIAQTAGKTPQDTEIGSSITIFFQTLGAALIVAADQSIFGNIFKQQVLNINFPAGSGVDVQSIIAAGETGFRNVVPEQYLGLVVDAAMVAVRKAFIPSIVFLGLTLVATVPLPYASIAGAVAGGGA